MGFLFFITAMTATYLAIKTLENLSERECFWCGEVKSVEDSGVVNINYEPVKLCNDCKDNDDDCKYYLRKMRI